MKDCVIIDKKTPQYKGNFHMHTARSWDAHVDPAECFKEYKDKGYDFCEVTDHEVYWDNDDYDTEDFITLPGVESAFIIDTAQPEMLMERAHFTSLHINLMNDETKGRPGFIDGQVLKRPIDYGISSWNNYIEYAQKQNQIVFINHPDWSRLEPEIMFGIHGAIAFEIWNSGGVVDCGGYTDEYRWDYLLKRGYRIWALTGDDTHKYGPEHRVCGAAFTMVSTDDFSRKGLVQAVKEGRFYPSTGPKIHDMRVENNILHMEFDPACHVKIVAGDLLARSFTMAPGETMDHIDWPVKDGLKYFRVQIHNDKGQIAWSQPVFPGHWDGKTPALMEDPHTPIPEDQKGLQ